MITNDPVLKNSHKFYEMTREEMWIDHMKKLRRAYELQKDY
jgi:CMP-N-acetylneuraminic acid synthetase